MNTFDSDNFLKVNREVLLGSKDKIKMDLFFKRKGVDGRV